MLRLQSRQNSYSCSVYFFLPGVLRKRLNLCDMTQVKSCWSGVRFRFAPGEPGMSYKVAPRSIAYRQRPVQPLPGRIEYRYRRRQQTASRRTFRYQRLHDPGLREQYRCRRVGILKCCPLYCVVGREHAVRSLQQGSRRVAVRYWQPFQRLTSGTGHKISTP